MKNRKQSTMRDIEKKKNYGCIIYATVIIHLKNTGNG